jgi:hypothetical protein
MKKVSSSPYEQTPFPDRKCVLGVTKLPVIVADGAIYLEKDKNRAFGAWQTQKMDARPFIETLRAEWK